MFFISFRNIRSRFFRKSQGGTLQDICLVLLYLACSILHCLRLYCPNIIPVWPSCCPALFAPLHWLLPWPLSCPALPPPPHLHWPHPVSISQAQGSRFENPLWWKFLSSLKPIGLNAILTYCPMPPSMPPVIRPLDRPAHGAQEYNRNNVNIDNNDKSGNINSNTIDDHHPNNNNNNNNNNANNINIINNLNINSDSDMNSSYTTFNTNYNLNSSNNLNSSQNFSLNSQIFSDLNGSQQTLSYSENENFLLDGKSNLSNQTLQSLLENEISEFHSADLRTSFNSPPRSQAASAGASTNVIYCDLSFENSKLVSNITNAPNNRKNNDQKNCHSRPRINW